jgi:hypothetical protein
MTPTAARRARPSTPFGPHPCVLLLALLLLGLLLASPALAEQPVGVLSVTGNVEGAEVWVDGEKVGAVPYTGYHPVGSRQVRVVADFYQPFVRKVDLVEGLTKSLAANMLAGQGTVEFAVQPPGATVFIDGNPVGPSPIRVRDLEPGAHRFRLEAAGFEPHEESFEFAKGRNLYFDLALDSSAGLFRVSSTPAGAAVWIDGEQRGVTPLEVSGIPLGEHQVRVALDGYADVFRPVDTRDGRKGVVEVALSDEGGSLKVKTGSGQATVRINGNPVGQGGRVRLARVDRGTLEVEVSEPGVEPARLSVRMPAAGSLVLAASLKPADKGGSELRELPPVYGRWTFWAATTAVAAGGVAGGLLVAQALEPPPPPSGDVLVVLP